MAPTARVAIPTVPRIMFMTSRTASTGIESEFVGQDLVDLRTAGQAAEVGHLWGAVAIALQHAQIDLPRTDRLAILMRHYARELMQVREVVDRPRRQ